MCCAQHAVHLDHEGVMCIDLQAYDSAHATLATCKHDYASDQAACLFGLSVYTPPFLLCVWCVSCAQKGL